jgi:hypothetical protein
VTFGSNSNFFCRFKNEFSILKLIQVPKPDLDTFVILKSLDNLRGVLIDDLSMDGRNEIVDMDKEDLHIMRYRPVDNYVEAGQIQLI